jgi:hypothetical protein
MKYIYFFLSIFLLTHTFHVSAQSNVGNILQMEQQGISIKKLDSTYKSAIHSDTTMAVFKTEKEQVQLQDAYQKLLQALGNYLSAHSFYWEKPTRCYNRIYFNASGKIDYFIYNFLGKEDVKPSQVQEAMFKTLVQQFIKDYVFSLKANEKFAQCSPTVYQPKK